MTHGSHEPVGEIVQHVSGRATQVAQLLTQLLDTVVRNAALRSQDNARQHRRAAGDVLRTAQTRARATWSRLDSSGWRRGAPPGDLIEAWATAHAWSGRVRSAGAAQQRAEREMRTRWPEVMTGYTTRVRHGQPPPAALMEAFLDHAAEPDGPSAPGPVQHRQQAQTPAREPAAPDPVRRPPAVSDQDRLRYAEALAAAGGTQLAHEVAASPIADQLWSRLAVAERHGHNVPLLLATVVTERSLADAGSPAKVLGWRVDRRLRDQHEPQHAQAGRPEPTPLAGRSASAVAAEMSPAGQALADVPSVQQALAAPVHIPVSAPVPGPAPSQTAKHRLG
jgi:hypothetical protein